MMKESERDSIKTLFRLYKIECENDDRQDLTSNSIRKPRRADSRISARGLSRKQTMNSFIILDLKSDKRSSISHPLVRSHKVEGP